MHCRGRRSPMSSQYILNYETSIMVHCVQRLISPGCELSDRIALARAISDLLRCRRAVLVPHDIQGLSHREIAMLLGVSLSASLICPGHITTSEACFITGRWLRPYRQLALAPRRRTMKTFRLCRCGTSRLYVGLTV